MDSLTPQTLLFIILLCKCCSSLPTEDDSTHKDALNDPSMQPSDLQESCCPESESTVETQPSKESRKSTLDHQIFNVIKSRIFTPGETSPEMNKNNVHQAGSIEEKLAEGENENFATIFPFLYQEKIVPKSIQLESSKQQNQRNADAGKMSDKLGVEYESYKKVYQSLLKEDSSPSVEKGHLDYFWQMRNNDNQPIKGGLLSEADQEIPKRHRPSSLISNTKAKQIPENGSSPALLLSKSVPTSIGQTPSLGFPQNSFHDVKTISEEEFSRLEDSLFSSSFLNAKTEELTNPDVKTYNLILTKDHRNGEDKSVLQTFQDQGEDSLSSDKSSTTKMEEVKKAVTSALGHEGQYQEALTQVIQGRGVTPIVKIINSTIPNLSELESTIDDLLGTPVVYKENRADNTIVGYLPRSDSSVIQALLNQTIGIKHGNKNLTATTNIVNIFIINIIEDQPQNDKLQVNDMREGTMNEHPIMTNEKISANQISLPTLNKYTESSIKFWQDLIDNLSLSQSKFKDTALKVSASDTSAVPSWPSLEAVTEPATNPHGLNLNKNTILNLLPDFVRLTTIPPVVPLYNASIYKNIGLKPSVLGLLPNQVFGLMNPKFHLLRNSTVGGIVRKDLIANLTAGLDEFSKRTQSIEDSISELIPENRNVLNAKDGIPHSEKISEIPNLSNPSQIPAIGTGRRPVQIKQVDEPALSLTNQNLFELLKQSSSKTPAKKTKANKKKNENEKSILSRLNLFNNGKKDGQVDTIMRAMAIGALPSGIAFATALFPYWAPFVFGKKRRRRSTQVDERNSTQDNYVFQLPKRKFTVKESNKEFDKLKDEYEKKYFENGTNAKNETVSLAGEDDEIVSNFLTSTFSDWKAENSVDSYEPDHILLANSIQKVSSTLQGSQNQLG